MVKLENDLNNFFDDDKITNLRLNLFGKYVLLNLIAKNTTGIFTDVIDALTIVFTPFSTNMSSLAHDVIIGMGKTELRVNVIEEFKEFVRNNKGMVTGKYFKLHHDFYLEFYTHELEDYNAIKKDTANDLFDRYAAAAHTHVLDFTPQFANEAAAFKLRYENAVEVQDINKGLISGDRSGKDSGRKELNIELFAAYNFTKYVCKSDYTYMHGIFPLETLTRHSHKEIKHFSGSEAALATVNVAEAIYDTNDWMLFQNTGPTDQRVGLELTADTEVGSVNGKVVRAGKSKSFKIITTGASGMHFLNVTNLNLTEGGSWNIDTYKED